MARPGPRSGYPGDLRLTDLGIVRDRRMAGRHPGGEGDAHLLGLPGHPRSSTSTSRSALRAHGIDKLTARAPALAALDHRLDQPRRPRQAPAYGIAPPVDNLRQGRLAARARRMAGSTLPARAAAPPHTEKVSRFGSTPCKASYRCTACLEPFDHFKCI